MAWPLENLRDVRVTHHSTNGVYTRSAIAPGDMPRLFDRLYRSPSAIASQKQGAGLGLPIVKRIVEAHDGHISIRSTPGRGTLVHVDLPYAEPSVARDIPS